MYLLMPLQTSVLDSLLLSYLGFKSLLLAKQDPNWNEIIMQSSGSEHYAMILAACKKLPLLLGLMKFELIIWFSMVLERQPISMGGLQLRKGSCLPGFDSLEES